jgi:hypothetical protein
MDRFPARMDLTSLGHDMADIALAALALDSPLVPEEASYNREFLEYCCCMRFVLVEWEYCPQTSTALAFVALKAFRTLVAQMSVAMAAAHYQIQEAENERYPDLTAAVSSSLVYVKHCLASRTPASLVLDESHST